VLSIKLIALFLPHFLQQSASSIVVLSQPSSFVLTLLSMAKPALLIVSLHHLYLPGVSCP
jgi:short-subunit dehydrogenase involved in D-alanine esterification of teichoic acids